MTRATLFFVCLFVTGGLDVSTSDTASHAPQVSKVAS